MKLTKQQLKQLIKEELQHVLNEAEIEALAFVQKAYKIVQQLEREHARDVPQLADVEYNLFQAIQQLKPGKM